MKYEEFKKAIKETFKTWLEDENLLNHLGVTELKREFVQCVASEIESDFLIILTEKELNDIKLKAYKEGFEDA